MSSMSRPQLPEAGFTLVEILLAVAILATVSVIVSVSFATTIRLRDRALDDAALEHRARNVLRLIADELAISRVHPKYRWVGQNADQDGRAADLLAFSTTVSSRARPDVAESDVVHVAYTRQKDRLLRYSLRNPYALTGDALDRTEVADGIVAFNVRYYDKRASVWRDQWMEGPSAMPAGVLVELTVDKRGQPRTYAVWVPTPPLATRQTLPATAGTASKP
jgi:general secretion pathway protein J